MHCAPFVDHTIIVHRNLGIDKPKKAPVGGCCQQLLDYLLQGKKIMRLVMSVGLLAEPIHLIRFQAEFYGK